MGISNHWTGKIEVNWSGGMDYGMDNRMYSWQHCVLDSFVLLYSFRSLEESPYIYTGIRLLVNT